MLEFLILGLATWRISYFLLEDDGPFRLSARLRHYVGADKSGEVTGLAFVFTCIYCMSVWVATVLWLAFDFGNGLAIPKIAAYSAIAVVTHRLTSK